MLKRNIPTRILAIKPGSNYLGVVVLDGRHLVFRAVKNIKPCPTHEKFILAARKLIKRLFSIHQPDIVIQEQLCYVQSLESKRVVEIAKEIKKLSANLTYREISPIIAKEYICKDCKTKQTKSTPPTCSPQSIRKQNNIFLKPNSGIGNGCSTVWPLFIIIGSSWKINNFFLHQEGLWEMNRMVFG